MHRGGTSVLARAVNLLDISAGDPARLMPPTEDNPGGYWENLRVAQLHDELLAHLGGWWSVPPVLEPGWELDPSLSPFWTWGSQLVQDHFEPYGRCFVKDPRLCLLLPFWAVLTPIGPTLHGLRHPGSVASSLARRDGFSAEHGAWLWLRHVDGAAATTPDALVVDYDDWFVDPDVVLERVAGHLGVGEPTRRHRAAVRTWIRDDLRRSDPAAPTGPLAEAAADVHAAVRSRGLPAALDVLAALPFEWRTRPPA
ncbi:MAG TPA: hypothetical protein VFU14_19470 [Acidimicrobiales bacterium]|nr:hypothetical protein [Acidimicrobiales bacterium]